MPQPISSDGLRAVKGDSIPPDAGKKQDVNSPTKTIMPDFVPILPAPVVFGSLNSQSDGLNTLKRMEFVLRGAGVVASYKFILNPEEFIQTEPNKATLTQTKSGGWVDEFGPGIPTISMKGTTGFKNGTKDRQHGFKQFKELRDLIRSYYSAAPPGAVVDNKVELILHNYTDGEHWVVVPKVFSLMRSVARPLLYLYDIQLICIRPASRPDSKSSGILNPRLPILDANWIQQPNGQWTQSDVTRTPLD